MLCTPQKRRGSGDIKENSKAGFLAGLDEALLSCREVAPVVEQDGNMTKFVGYTLPRWGDRGWRSQKCLSLPSNGEQVFRRLRSRDIVEISR